MRFGLILPVLCSIALIAMSDVALAQGAVGDTVVYAEDSDAELNAAMKAARDNLAVFWSHYDKPRPGEGPFLLKVALPTKGGSLEHIWMRVTAHGEKIVGVLVNEPDDIAGMSLGSKVTVTPGQVSDWTYVHAGVAYGQFSNRVLVKQLDAEGRAAILKDLSPTPLEDAKP